MTQDIEKQIAALLKKAEPLRHVPEDDPLSAELTKAVDEINRLRALQAGEKARPGVVEGEDPQIMADRK